jgi:hypothetical protein
MPNRAAEPWCVSSLPLADTLFLYRLHPSDLPARQGRATEGWLLSDLGAVMDERGSSHTEA